MNDNEVILERLEKQYHGAKPGLRYQNPFELLIATIMSAQTTDRQVNEVTKKLFAQYPNAEAMAAIDEETLGEMIKSTGFYRSKAANVRKTCRALLEKHGGQVPQTMEELTSLAGVGRKTANVVLSNAFGVPAIAVDTHVFRVSNRLGLASAKNELDTEMQLRQNIPEDKWSDAHHWLIWHGRRVCSARNPKCGDCFLLDVCGWGKAQQ